MQRLFAELQIPVHVFTRQSDAPQKLLQKSLRDGHEAFALMQDVWFLGMVDEQAFAGGGAGPDLDEIRARQRDYDGLLIFGVEMKERPDGRMPTRTQLADITRAFNREFHYTPVVVVFRYGKHITLAAAERIPYKHTWREGEKAGKVSLIKDINIEKPHAGHGRILSSLSVGAIREYDRKNRVESFADLYKGWQKVLSTNVLNEQFYKDYQQLSRGLINKIFPAQIDNKLKAHQGILNLLNRMMFICFIQKKGWMMHDQEFLFHLWQDYLETGREEDNFHADWINKVFFLAFNGKAISDKRGKLFLSLPKKYHEAILEFPYLNGGLFTKTTEDEFLLDDGTFKEIFAFLQGYIFTIDEDTAEDVNLEINPKLLGKMYEGMINATDLDDVDAEHGIVYTERPEINFMTRRSFVEILHNKLPKGFTSEFLYHFCFNTSAGRLELLERYKPDAEVLKAAILSVTALDPSCGSGSMLLGLIQLMIELLTDLANYTGQSYTNKELFQLKKQIISESIYGVDIKEWAVRIAELRFWLYMIADVEFSTEELTKAPLLPNLDFKLRRGNSIIQEAGNLEFSLKGLMANKKRNAGAAGKLNRFISRKKQFVCNQAETDTSFEKLKDEELIVFKEFLKEHIFENNKKIIQYTRGDGQQTIFGDEKKNLFEAEIHALERENEELQRILGTMHTTKRLPFSFDIDFMEVFLTKDDPGFDLVIGNPPYVRQEDILPADNALELERLLLPENRTEKAEVSKAYKEKLSAKVYKTWPFLTLKAKTLIDNEPKTIDLYGKKVPGRSDLYVYFQLLCPSLLNSKGTFCFIISNSWLDVEYGGFVQQFLLKHTRLHAIYDCTVRSFSVGINTIIYLHSAITHHDLPHAQIKSLLPVNEPVRFIMNKADYTETAYAPLLVEQEHCTTNTFREHYRVIVKTQKELWDEGFDEETMQYQSNKWGGKYLRAPEIFYKILEKGKDKLVSLKTIADVRFGIKTGANEFFILTRERAQQFGIEEEFLAPIIKSPKQCKTIQINPADLPSLLFYCHKCRNELTATKALKYIEWGEESEIINGQEVRAFHLRPSTRGRRNWWDVGYRKIPQTVFPCGFGDIFKFYQNNKVLIDKRLYEVDFISNDYNSSMNSTLTVLFLEVGTRTGLGDGLMDVTVYEAKNILVYQKAIDNPITRPVKSIFTELGFDRLIPIRDQEPNPLPDRKELDDIIFDELGLTEEERKEVYWATAELVKQRLDKAGSR